MVSCLHCMEKITGRTQVCDITMFHDLFTSICLVISQPDGAPAAGMIHASMIHASMRHTTKIYIFCIEFLLSEQTPDAGSSAACLCRVRLFCYI